MNKPIIVTAAIVVLLLAIGSWLYLFLFGAPQSPNEVFVDLGIVPTASEENVATDIITNDNDGVSIDIDTTVSRLQQLTVRPVAGYWVDNATVRYMEQGTGHIYEIDTQSGNEERISNTSIPVVTTAIFGPDGTSAVITTEASVNPRQLVATIRDNSLTTTELPPGADNVLYTSSSTIMYTRNTANGSIGYTYNIKNQNQAEVFTTQLQSYVVHHRDDTDEIYLTPRPATELEGVVLQLINNQPQIIRDGAFALVADIENQWLSQMYANENELVSEVFNLDTKRSYYLPITLLPEKCDWFSGRIFCAAPLTPPSYTYAEDWYKGTTLSNDMLWEVIPTREEARLLINPETSIGRPLDMVNVTVHTTGNIFFINRLDNTLWLYDANTN